MTYYKTIEGYVYVPFDDIDGIKKHPDKSISLKLIGGKYHNMRVRMYAPYTEVVFPDGESYELHPPLGNRESRSKKNWVMVHNSGLSQHRAEISDRNQEAS